MGDAGPSRAREALFKAVAIVVGTLLGATLIEVGLRVKHRMSPMYEVLFLDPDPVLGWKQSPGLEYVWSTRNYECDDFRVAVRANALGFRDHDRERRKPEGTTRLAVLGDSLIEALQVPLEQTGAQVLEGLLNSDSRLPGKYEVLNFGVSNYGVGQYLITYQEHVRAFSPDYVFVFLAGFHMWRTPQTSEPGFLEASRMKGKKLWIRPTFVLEDGQLVARPPRDYPQYVAAHRRAILEYFGPTRMRPVDPGSFWDAGLRRPPRTWSEKSMLFRLVASRLRRPPRTGARWIQLLTIQDEEDIVLNYAILAELNRRIGADGGRMILVDATLYYNSGDIPLAQRNKEFAAASGAGYIPLYEALLREESAGHRLYWNCDGHFNRRGNEVLGRALYEWTRGAAAAPPRRASVASRPL